MQKGKPWSNQEQQKILQRLERMDYFHLPTQLSYFKDKNKRLLYTYLELKNKPTNSLEGWAFQHSEGHPEYFLDVHLRNLLNTSRDFRLQLQTSPEEKYFEVNYKEPWLWNSPIDLRGHFYFRQTPNLQQLETNLFFSTSPASLWQPYLGAGYSQRSDSNQSLSHSTQSLGLFLNKGRVGPIKLSTELRLTYYQALRKQSSFLQTTHESQFTWEHNTILPQLILRNKNLHWLEANTPNPLFNLSLGGTEGLRAYPTGHYSTDSYLLMEPQILWRLHRQLHGGPFYEWAVFQTFLENHLKIRDSYGLYLLASNASETWEMTFSYGTRKNLSWEQGFVQVKIQHLF